MRKSFKQFVVERTLTDEEIELVMTEDIFASLNQMIKQHVDSDIKPLQSKVAGVKNEIEDLVARVTKLVRERAWEDLKLSKVSGAEFNTIKKILNNTEGVVRQLVGHILKLDISGENPKVLTNIRTGDKA